jgi:hypothetical protein
MAVGVWARQSSWGLAAATGLTALAAGWFAALPHEELTDSLTIILALCAAAGSLSSARWQDAINVSASFVCVMLAAAYLGAASAFAIAVFAESVTCPRSSRPRSSTRCTRATPVGSCSSPRSSRRRCSTSPSTS